MNRSLTRTRSASLLLVLILLVASPSAAAPQRGGHGGISVGHVGAFHPGWHHYGGGFGVGWPYHYGYPVFGFGYPVYGYGYSYPYYGWYGGWGYGPYGGIGMSPFDQATYLQQQFALNASRYNLQNAQAVQAYQAANLYQQQAIATALGNVKQAASLAGYPAGAGSSQTGQASTPSSPTIPLDLLFNVEGRVRWPEVTPKDQELREPKAAADQAIERAFHEYRTTKRATVSSVVDARNKLHAFGRSALLRVESRQRPAVARQYRAFLETLDTALALMGEPGGEGSDANAAPPPPKPPEPGDTTKKP